MAGIGTFLGATAGATINALLNAVKNNTSKGGSSSSPRSFISVSWRLPYQTDACTDDEYLKWGCLCYYNDTRQNPL